MSNDLKLLEYDEVVRIAKRIIQGTFTNAEIIETGVDLKSETSPPMFIIDGTATEIIEISPAIPEQKKGLWGKIPAVPAQTQKKIRRWTIKIHAMTGQLLAKQT